MAKKNRISDKKADDLYASAKALPAALTKEQMIEMEDVYREDRNGLARRAALATLTVPCAGLFESVEQDRETAAAMASVALAMRGYIEHLEAVKNIVVAAETRVSMALCAREDMADLFAEAEQERAAS